MLLIESSVTIASTGKELFENRCTQCHQLPKPQDLTGGRWAKRVDAMVEFVDLTEIEKKLLLEHIQQLLKNK